MSVIALKLQANIVHRGLLEWLQATMSFLQVLFHAYLIPVSLTLGIVS